MATRKSGRTITLYKRIRLQHKDQKGGEGTNQSFILDWLVQDALFESRIILRRKHRGSLIG